MASQVREGNTIGNFKPSRVKRKKEKNRDKRKDRPGNCERHLAAIRRMPCAIPGCNVVGCDAHHLRQTGERGAAIKSPDKYSIPLCSLVHHIDQATGVHSVGTKRELSWLKERGIDGLELAAALWNASPDDVAMFKIVMANKAGSKVA